MPYLGGFEHDVFVSYSHGHTRADGTSRLKQWSQRMVEELEGQLKDLRPDFDSLRIWMDVDLDPTQALTDELREAVHKSAILMVLMSPRYLMSSWCKEELDWFQGQVSDRRNAAGRVFVVRTVSTLEHEWPGFIRDERGHAIPGFWFHAPGVREPGKEPYGWNDTHAFEPKFHEALSTLRTTLIKRLEELKRRTDAAAAEKEAAESPATVATSARLYLHARPVDSAVRDRIAALLQQAGHVVVPWVEPSAPDLEGETRESAERQKALATCDAVLIVRTRADDEFQWDFQAIAIDECERVVDRLGRPLRAAVVGPLDAPPPFGAEGRNVGVLDITDGEWLSKLAAWLASSRDRT